MQHWLLVGNRAIYWGHIGIMENGKCYYNRVYIGVIVWNKVFRVEVSLSLQGREREREREREVLGFWVYGRLKESEAWIFGFEV